MKIVILTIIYKGILNRFNFINKTNKFTKYKKDILKNSIIINIYILDISILINKNKYYIFANLY